MKPLALVYSFVYTAMLFPSFGQACGIAFYTALHLEQAEKIEADVSGFQRQVNLAVDECKAVSKKRTEASPQNPLDQKFEQSLAQCEVSQTPTREFGDKSNLTNTYCRYEAAKTFSWELVMEGLPPRR